MQILLALVLNAVALWVTAQVVPGFRVGDPVSLILVAVVLGVVNTFIKPILSFVTAPISVVTLGLFAFVVNAVVLFIVSSLVPQGLQVDGWMPAILGAVVLSVVATVLTSVLKDVAKVGKK